MKKLLLVLVSFLLLVGCQSVATVKPQTKNLEFTVTTTYKNTEYILYASTDEEANLNLKVKTPESLENLKLVFHEDSTYLEFLDLIKELPLNSIEEESVFRIICEGFKVAQNTTKIYTSDDKYFIIFRFDNKNYYLYFGQTGLPLKIEGNNVEIIFKGVKILN